MPCTEHVTCLVLWVGDRDHRGCWRVMHKVALIKINVDLQLGRENDGSHMVISDWTCDCLSRDRKCRDLWPRHVTSFLMVMKIKGQFAFPPFKASDHQPTSSPPSSSSCTLHTWLVHGITTNALILHEYSNRMPSEKNLQESAWFPWSRIPSNYAYLVSAFTAFVLNQRKGQHSWQSILDW